MKRSNNSKFSCINCINCLTQDINGNVLCRLEGITTYNYYCKKYRLKPVAPLPSANRNTLKDTFITCSKCNYYDPDEKNKALGICLYYKMRPFKGDLRKACSRYKAKVSETTSFNTNPSELFS